MEIRDVIEEEMTTFFMNDPALCYLGLPDRVLHILYTEKKYPANPNSMYKGVYKEEVLIAIVRYELYTEISLDVHFYIATHLQHKGLALQIRDLCIAFCLNEHPQIIKIIATVPSSCEHVQRCLERFGMKLEGVVSQCIIWRQQLVDLMFYGLPLNKPVIGDK